MNIKTSRFGEISIGEEELLQFPEGILGFPDERFFVLIEGGSDGNPFKWLQSSVTPGLAFLVIDPCNLTGDYLIALDADTARIIEVGSVEACAALVIVKVPQGEPMGMTANLKAPLLINPDLRVGRQIIMASQSFSLEEPVLPRIQARAPKVGKAQVHESQASDPHDKL